MQKKIVSFVLSAFVLVLGVGMISLEALAASPTQCFCTQPDVADTQCEDYCAPHGGCHWWKWTGCTCNGEGACKCFLEYMCMDGNFDGGGKITTGPCGECNYWDHLPPSPPKNPDWWENKDQKPGEDQSE